MIIVSVNESKGKAFVEEENSGMHVSRLEENNEFVLLSETKEPAQLGTVSPSPTTVMVQED